MAKQNATQKIRSGVLCEVQTDCNADLCVATWSANRIEPRVQSIAAQQATLEIGSANSIALFSDVFISSSALVKEIRPGVLCDVRSSCNADLRVTSWSANRIEPRVQSIASQQATLEIGSANSVALFSHVFFSQSVLATTAIKRDSLGLASGVWSVAFEVLGRAVLLHSRQHGFF